MLGIQFGEFGVRVKDKEETSSRDLGERLWGFSIAKCRGRKN